MVNALCLDLSFLICSEVPQRWRCRDQFRGCLNSEARWQPAASPPTFVGFVISLLLIVPSSMLPGTRGQELHMGNNLTNHLSVSPARTPALKLLQLLMLGLQLCGMSVRMAGTRAMGPTLFRLCPATENRVRWSDPQR